MSATDRPEHEHRSAQHEGSGDTLPTARRRAGSSPSTRTSPPPTSRGWATSTRPTRISATRSTRCAAWRRSSASSTRMFEQLADCRFTIVDTVVDERGALLVWDFDVPHPPLPAAGRAAHPRCEPPALRRGGARRPSPRLLGRRRRALRQAAAARPGAAVPQAPPGLTPATAPTGRRPQHRPAPRE